MSELRDMAEAIRVAQDTSDFIMLACNAYWWRAYPLHPADVQDETDAYPMTKRLADKLVAIIRAQAKVAPSGQRYLMGVKGDHVEGVFSITIRWVPVDMPPELWSKPYP